MSAVESQSVSWWPVMEYAAAEAALFGVDLGAGRLPVPGTPSWCSLPDGGAKLAALLLLGAQYALFLDGRQAELAEASRAIASAADWPKVAREVNRRSAFRDARPWSKRVSR